MRFFNTEGPVRPDDWIYPPSAYDDRWCLKPSWMTVVLWLYSIRHLLLVVILYFPIMPGQSQMAFLRELLSVPMTIVELPALLFLVAWRYRRPEASQFWRKLWRRGRLLLLMTLMPQAALMAWDLRLESAQVGDHRFAVLPLLAQLGAIWYVLAARRLKDVLADYPTEKTRV